MELMFFIAFLLEKFENDNHWLLKKVSLFDKEAKNLKDQLETCQY